VPSLRAKNPAISPEVEQVINIALTKDPKQRFGSVLAFATALEQAGQGISTQFAPPPPVQPPLLPTDPALPPAPDLYGTQQQMIYTTPPTPIPAPRLKSGWGLYKAQWIAMVIGILIYGVAEFLMDMLTIHFPYTFFYPIGGISFLPSLVLLFYGISLVIPLFFGARYGPWVGLIVAFVGALAGDWLANVSGQNILFWPWDLAWLPLGFIAGLAYVKTRGQYNRRGLVGFGVFMGTVAILANAIGVAIATGISVTFWVNLVSYFLGNLPGVLFLFIALLISGSITRRRRAFRY
jgi:energy-coupling factor transport system substrate-specific component